jgi:hypothetical protein
VDSKKSAIFVIGKETNKNMKTELEIVKDMMSKYNLTAKDLFSFCICAVNASATSLPLRILAILVPFTA